ncbi:replication factor C large subunit [Candidatus Woesearchaeota archaeon]|nr:replication factor C large subunit [Candidatus Woesearchaeota archaeon]
MIPWINKYAPVSLNDVVGQDKQLELLKKYVVNFESSRKPVLLYGGTGVGKTASVVAFANDNNFELVEMNASDTRNAESVSSLLSSVVNQVSLFGSDKLILVDEVDGLSGTKDRGGLQALIKILAVSKFPFVIICEDAYSDKLKPLRKICELVEFDSLCVDDILVVFKKICASEGIVYDDSALTQLARMCGGDLRAGINDLQSLSLKGSLNDDDVSFLDSRDSVQEIEDALFKVFKTLNVDVALGAFDNVSEDLDKIFLWVEENIPYEYLKPKSLMLAYDNLSLANVFYGRIRRWQYYRFYVYCYNLLSAGIALSKDEKNPISVKYKPSSRLLKIWIFNNSVAKRRSIAQKAGRITHTASKKAFSSVVPFLQLMFHNNHGVNSFVNEFDLSDEEVTWLKKKV